MDTVRRWSKTAKKYIEVSRPEGIAIYNKFMGGVDKHDFLVALNAMRTRTRRWPTCVILHLKSMCLVNAWLTYREK